MLVHEDLCGAEQQGLGGGSGAAHGAQPPRRGPLGPVGESSVAKPQVDLQGDTATEAFHLNKI